MRGKPEEVGTGEDQCIKSVQIHKCASGPSNVHGRLRPERPCARLSPSGLAAAGRATLPGRGGALVDARNAAEMGHREFSRRRFSSAATPSRLERSSSSICRSRPRPLLPTNRTAPSSNSSVERPCRVMEFPPPHQQPSTLPKQVYGRGFAIRGNRTITTPSCHSFATTSWGLYIGFRSSASRHVKRHRNVGCRARAFMAPRQRRGSARLAGGRTGAYRHHSVRP
jgi:hypothetical protein